jgi:hypothetical protein
MILLDVLSAKQSLESPEKPLLGTFAPLHNQDRWSWNPPVLDVFAGSGYRFFFATVEAKAWNKVKYAPSL